MENEKDDNDLGENRIRIHHSTGTYSDIEGGSAITTLIQKATAYFDAGFVRQTSTALEPSAGTPTDDQALWAAIRDRTNAISFEQYNNFIERVFCAPRTSDQGRAVCCPEFEDSGPIGIGSTSDNCRNMPCSTSDIEASNNFVKTSSIGSPSINERYEELCRRPGIYGTDAYQLLKLATQAFLLFESGVVIEGARDPGSGRFLVPNSSGLRGRKCDDNVPVEKERGNLNDTSFGTLQSTLERYLTTTLGANRALPYLKRIVSALPSLNLSTEEGPPYCNIILQHRLSCPSLLELIWSYWHEEGMLVQTMNAISLRFQNKKRHAKDPLANLALDSLRPLNNILWGYIQDEPNRLSIQRRCYEYDSQYGITLVGKAVPKLESADSRSQFIKAFHNLLYRTVLFYREDDDNTIKADAFSLLNALREVHIILAEGAINQFGDLPWTARHEMLLMQWMLARPETKEFLRGRYSVPYQETWMGAVDDMKRLQGWSDVTVTHFHELAIKGEQILLSIRYGDWIDINNQEQARNWARDWRPEIQRYIHAYYAVSGVDLTSETVDARAAEARYAQPSLLLQKRLAMQQPKNRVAGPNQRLANSRRTGYAPLTNKMANRLRIERS
ncbi:MULTISPECIES: hypothetical protein [Nitrosomonas]|uniref:Uncharacterized protein n=1 Tax=Nitrosomonas communis TaxID=44574 RepID=A0A5D3YA57_9PROT|nr:MULTISPECIES: hypothetical protein [Nitrosomonas]TYP84851.1 hypothetical protein BCL69_10375 [Nitrosomonas communis]UVS63160.1 hypothetical protein NX761_08770 [Nitrosomonas sp. PLL12]